MYNECCHNRKTRLISEELFLLISRATTSTSLRTEPTRKAVMDFNLIARLSQVFGNESKSPPSIPGLLFLFTEGAISREPRVRNNDIKKAGGPKSEEKETDYFLARFSLFKKKARKIGRR